MSVRRWIALGVGVLMVGLAVLAFLAPGSQTWCVALPVVVAFLAGCAFCSGRGSQVAEVEPVLPVDPVPHVEQSACIEQVPHVEQAPQVDNWLTLAEASQALGLKEARLRQLCRAGDLQGRYGLVNDKRGWLVSPESVQAYKERKG